MLKDYIIIFIILFNNLKIVILAMSLLAYPLYILFNTTIIKYAYLV